MRTPCFFGLALLLQCCGQEAASSVQSGSSLAAGPGAAGAPAPISAPVLAPEARAEQPPPRAPQLMASAAAARSEPGMAAPEQPASEIAANAAQEEKEPSYSVMEPLSVGIALSDSDWELIRHEGRDLPDSGCDEVWKGYTEVTAQLTVQGQMLADVGLRKKGFLGSLSVLRPSFSIDFGAKRRADGYKRLTLNNNRQDTTNTHQCLAYELFTRAGLHAPRCGLARVSVNGVDKGYYTNVEPIKKPFLRREFGDEAGNLYELSSSTDLSVAQANRIELKSDGEGHDRADLMRLLNALTLPDDQLLAALGSLLDLDEYVSFWVVETVVGQWDGLNGNGNNAYLYHSARDDRFHPIAWGCDQAFAPLSDLLEQGTIGVMLSTQLAKQLWALPEIRNKYKSRMRMLLDTTWNADELIEKASAIGQLTAAPAAALQTTVDFIRDRKPQLLRALDSGQKLGELTFPITDTCEPVQPASAELSFTWDPTPRNPTSAADALALITAAKPILNPGPMNIRVADRQITFAPGSVLGVSGTDGNGSVFMAEVGTDVATGHLVLIALFTPLETFRPGEVAFHGFETYGVVAEVTVQGLDVLGYLGNGSIRLDQVGTQAGDPIRGAWSGKLEPGSLK